MTFTRFLGGAWQTRLFTLLSLVAVFALVASACGDDDDDDDDADATEEETEEAADTATEAEGDATEPAGTATEDAGDGGAPVEGGVEIRIPAGEPILIGISTPLTGPDAGLGIDTRDGFLTGIEQWKRNNEEQIGGHDIDTIVEDDGCSDAATATAAAERIVNTEGVVAVLGPLCSGGAQAAIPLYNESGLVSISASASRVDLAETQPEPKFFFRTPFLNNQEGELQARYMIDELGATAAFVVDDTEPYGEDLANNAQEVLEGEDVQVTREKIERGTTDFSALASRAASDNPDVFYFAGFNPEGQLLLSALRQAGYEGTFVSGDGVLSVADFIEPDPDVAEGAVIFGVCEYAEEITSLYDEIIGNDPTTPFIPHAFDAAQVLLDAINQVAEDDGGELVIDTGALNSAIREASFDGTSGSITFDENGDRVGQTAEEVGLQICLVEDGAFVAQ